MNSNPKFLVGEKVARVMDGLEGKVVEISTYNGEFSYMVDLGREPMEGFIDDVWSGSERAWRPVFTLHAHVSTQSRDCDGDYPHEHVDRPNAIERTEEFGDLHFKERILGGVVSFHAENGNLNVTPRGLLWMQSTDEGYVHTEVRWCEDDCDEADTYRDHTAERAGY